MFPHRIEMPKMIVLDSGKNPEENLIERNKDAYLDFIHDDMFSSESSKDIKRILLVDEILDLYEGGLKNKNEVVSYEGDSSINAMKGHSFLIKEIRNGLNDSLKKVGIEIINYQVPAGDDIWENDLQIEITKIK